MFWLDRTLNRLNWRFIAYVIGYVLLIEAALLLAPLVVDLIYGEHDAYAYLITIALCLIIGFPLTKIDHKRDRTISRDGLFAVGACWIVVSLMGALPFYITRDIPNYIDCFFETVSGFTTTGSSILTDIESLSHANLFWRSFTHWIGGMGVLVFLLVIMPGSNDRTMHLMRAESPGPSVGKLVPRMRKSAAILYTIYVFLTIVLVVLLCMAGMPLFDSLCHAFGTAGTGGFSIKAASIAYYDSATIDAIITIFMLLFGVNFNIYYYLLIKNFKDVKNNEEFKTYVGIVVACIALITINILPMYNNIFSAIRYSSFQVATIITTTGYATCDFNLWPMFSKIILMLLMVIGASAGSTGGGIKVSRFLILVKKVKLELQRLVHEQKVDAIVMDGRVVDDKTVNGVTSYFCIYILIVFSCWLLISIDNLDFETTISAVFACIGNIGPGFSLVGATGNFDCFSYFSKIVLSFAMLIGRLEIYPILIFLFPALEHNRKPKAH